MNYYGVFENLDSSNMKNPKKTKSKEDKYLEIKKKYIFDILIPQLRYKHIHKYMP